MNSSSRTASNQDTLSTHTLTAAYHRLSSLSLTAFRAQFRDTYEQTKSSTERAHYTIGISLSQSGQIETVSPPQITTLTSSTAETHTPDEFNQHDIYLNVFSDTLPVAVQDFRETIEVAFLEQVVLAETHPDNDPQLPSDEYARYRDTVETFHTDSHSDA